MRTIHRSPVLRSARRRGSARERDHEHERSRARRAPVTPLAAWTWGAITRLAITSSNLAVGYAVTARHASDEGLVAECVSLASLHRAVASELASLLASAGAPPPRIITTCGERLRWEWLASSARLIDGASESRLLAECARIRSEADDAAAEPRALRRRAALSAATDPRRAPRRAGARAPRGRAEARRHHVAKAHELMRRSATKMAAICLGARLAAAGPPNGGALPWPTSTRPRERRSAASRASSVATPSETATATAPRRGALAGRPPSRRRRRSSSRRRSSACTEGTSAFV